MSQIYIDYRDSDRQIWEEELGEFVPSRMLDAHIHCYRLCDYPEGPPDWKGPPNLRGGDHDLETLNRCAEVLYPGRRMQYLILGTPSPGIDVARHTESVRRDLEEVAGVRHHRLVTPACDLEEIERDLENPRFIGLKPYRTYSVTGDIAQCRIHEFLPHEQMELADERGWWVTMHLSRFHGCADPTQPRRSRGVHHKALSQHPLAARPLRAQFHLLADSQRGRETPGPAQHSLRYLARRRQTSSSR